MKLHTVGFCVGEAVQNVWRNPVLSLASATTSAISLLVLGVFLLLGQNVGHLSQVVESQVTVRVFAQAHTSAADLTAMREGIRKVHGVGNVTFESKAAALRQLKQEFGAQGNLLNSLQSQNPLLDSFIVQAADPNAVPAIAKAVRRLPNVQHVSYQSQVVGRLLSVVNGVRIAGVVLALLLALGALFMIQNAIRVGIFARRREIAVMHLVGATDSLVRLPFVLEGLAFGIMGAVIAAAVLYFGYNVIYGAVQHTLSFLPLLPPTSSKGLVALIGLFGCVIGIMGSQISLRRMNRSV